MMKLRHILGLIMMVIGIVSINAVPYVPHHHHEGKVCLEESQAQDCHDSDTLGDIHVEESDYDLPREVSLAVLIAPMVTQLACGTNWDIIYEETVKRDEYPEKTEFFCWIRYAARTQILRGSPLFS